ncbi:hypothetical protein ABIB15_002829 [Marisediminicola sp. UYEF4]|uniref:DUF2510 domain-containing protein n=1 Tax=Marisediminicola sp. UYEF4 TaxID=1756384 RepID=UPI003391C3C0
MPAAETAPLAPSGWYRDPLGLPQLRWWNGMMWTNQIEEPRAEIQVSSAYKVELVSSP